jgi:hypothetical protein
MRGPSVSPFLNLLRPGNSALNYYGDVRPQQRYNTAISTLQAETNQLATDVYQQPGAGLGINTGHPSQFLNYQRFFLTTTATPGFGQQRQLGAGAAGLAPPRGGGLTGAYGATGGFGRGGFGGGARGGR